MVDRKIAPPIHDAVTFQYILPPLQKEYLKNNIPLYWLNAGTQDVVQIDWVFEAGLWQESHTGIAQAVASLLKNGTSSRNSLEINEAIEFYGASLRIAANNDFTTVTLHSLTRHLPSLLPVIREIITEATFPGDELDIYKQNALQRLLVSLRKAEFVANRHIDTCLFGPNHPYGRFTEIADIEQLQTEGLRQYHSQYYHSNNCRIFMAGKINEDHIALVSRIFGQEPWGRYNGTPPESVQYSKEPASERKYRIQNDEQGVQGAIRIARAFPDMKHPDFLPSKVLNTIFGSYFGSRLMTNIREEKGFTYSISSYIYNHKHEGALLIGTEAGREVCEQTIAEVYKEMDKLCREPVPDEELSLVKNYILGSLLGDLEGPFSIMQRWKNILLNDLPEDQFARSIDVYKHVTAEKLQEMALKYLDKNDYYEVVVI